MNKLKTILVPVDSLSLEILEQPIPCGDLTKEQKREMALLRMKGRTIEVWCSSVDGWREVTYPQWLDCQCYRVKPTQADYRIAELEDELLALASITERKEKELERLLR